MAAADTKDVKTLNTKCKVLHEATIGKAASDPLLWIRGNMIGIYDSAKLIYNRRPNFNGKISSAKYLLIDNYVMGLTINPDTKIRTIYISKMDMSNAIMNGFDIGIIKTNYIGRSIETYIKEKIMGEYTLFHKDGKAIKIAPNSKLMIDSADNKITSIATSPKITEQRLVCFVGASDVPETDNFIGIIDEDSEYIAPHMYDLGYTFPIDGKEVPVWYNFGAIYGEVNVY